MEWTPTHRHSSIPTNVSETDYLHICQYLISARYNIYFDGPRFTKKKEGKNYINLLNLTMNNSYFVDWDPPGACTWLLYFDLSTVSIWQDFMTATAALGSLPFRLHWHCGFKKGLIGFWISFWGSRQSRGKTDRTGCILLPRAEIF